MAFPPGGFEISRAQLRVQFNETLEMRAGRWHQHCLEKEENSARPLAARITGYLSRASIQKGANDRSWHEAAQSECPLFRRSQGLSKPNADIEKVTFMTHGHSHLASRV